MHLQEDIAAADKLAADENLWDRWPAGEILDSLSQIVVGEHVMRIILNAMHAKDLNNSVGETTLGCFRVSLQSNFTINNSYFPS
jgi:hypothetical protein